MSLFSRSNRIANAPSVESIAPTAGELISEALWTRATKEANKETARQWQGMTVTLVAMGVAATLSVIGLVVFVPFAVGAYMLAKQERNWLREEIYNTALADMITQPATRQVDHNARATAWDDRAPPSYQEATAGDRPPQYTP